MLSNQKRLLYIFIFLIFIFSCVFYLPNLPPQYMGNEGELISTISDKLGDIIQTIKKIPHSPLAILSIQVLRNINYSPKFQFVTNWLLLTINSVLLLVIISSISLNTNYEYVNSLKLILGFILSLIFLTYPLSLYSFSFVSTRGGVLSVTFTLLVILTVIKYEKEYSPPQLYEAWAVFFFVLASFCHFIGAISGVIIILYLLRKIYNKGVFNDETYRRTLLPTLTIVITWILITKLLIDTYYRYDIYQEKIPYISTQTYINSLSQNLLTLILPTNYFPIKGIPQHPYYSIIALFLIVSIITLIAFLLYREISNAPVVPFIFIFSILLSPFFTNLDLLSCNTLYYLLAFFLATLGIVISALINFPKIIRYSALIFLAMIGGGTLFLSFTLIKEIKNPEILWFSSASNNPSNPEPWRYLGRLLLEKAEGTSEPQEREKLYEASLQCWNEILSIVPEDIEALVKSARCKLHLSPLEAEKTLDIAISLDPINKDALREKLNIYLLASEENEDNTKLQRILYNTYLTYLLLGGAIKNEDAENILKLALNHHDEIFLERLLTQHNIIPSTPTYNKFIEACSSSKLIVEKIKIPTLNDGEKFQPPANAFIEVYKRKNIKPLITAWSHYEQKLGSN